MKRSRQTTWKTRAPFLASPRWTLLMMVSVLAVHCIKLSSALALSRRYTCVYTHFRYINLHSQVGWITCDNASINITMLEAFAKRLNTSDAQKGCKCWDNKTRHIRYSSFPCMATCYWIVSSCLAHIINLATQAVLSTYSKTKFFNPEEPEEHDPDLSAVERDVVGLVRAITVKVYQWLLCLISVSYFLKVRSSAKRKERFKLLQAALASISKTLLLDMKVHWSSTLSMLTRVRELKSVCASWMAIINYHI